MRSNEIVRENTKKEPGIIKLIQESPRIRATDMSQKDEGKPSIVREERTMKRLQG